MKKIFVAGHNGMVGSAILHSLEKEKKYDLITIDRKNLDLRNKEAVAAFLQKTKPDTIILSAAKVGGILANSTYPADFIFDNLEIELSVTKAAFEEKIDRFLFLGSSCIYPKECPQPMREEYLLSGYLEPTNEGYAIAKIVGIKMLESLFKQHGFKSISIMPCNLYGPHDSFDLKNSHVLSALVRKFCDAVENKQEEVSIWGTGNARREFMYVEDLAEAVKLVLEKAEFDSSIINAGVDYDVSIKELARKIAQQTGFTGKMVFDTSKPDGTMKKLLESSKIKKLGFTPGTNLEEGIKKMINIYKTTAR
jgi:GDP-L-fucose synthase